MRGFTPLSVSAASFYFSLRRGSSVAMQIICFTIATDDTIRSLLISHYLLGTQEFMMINHTDCGMLTFKDEDLRERLERETGTAVVAPSHFHSFVDTTTNVRRQV